MTSDKPTWTNERRKLRELIPWKRNPRQIRVEQAKRLIESLNDFGQVELIAIGPNNEIYNGHQRLNVLMNAYGPDYEVDVRVASRSLTEKERERLTVFLHRGATGEWDFDVLSEWDVEDLIDWGFNPWEIGMGEIIGVEREQLTDKRHNNNLSIIGTGANVVLNFGKLMATIPSDIYDRVYAYVMSPEHESVRAGLCAILEAGLDAKDRDN